MSKQRFETVRRSDLVEILEAAEGLEEKREYHVKIFSSLSPSHSLLTANKNVLCLNDAGAAGCRATRALNRISSTENAVSVPAIVSKREEFPRLHKYTLLYCAS